MDENQQNKIDGLTYSLADNFAMARSFNTGNIVGLEGLDVRTDGDSYYFKSNASGDILIATDFNQQEVNRVLGLFRESADADNVVSTEMPANLDSNA